MSKQDKKKTVAAFLDSGYEYSCKNDHDMAITNYNKAINLDPNNIEAYYLRGIVYYEKQNYDQAIKDYTKAINEAKKKTKKIDPKIAMVYGNRGMVYKNKGDNKKALEDYNKAIENDPNNVIAYINRGNLYAISEGTLDMAIDDYNTALSLDPNNSDAKKSLELIQKSKKNIGSKVNLSDAIEEKEKAIGGYKKELQKGITAINLQQETIKNEYLNNVEVVICQVEDMIFGNPIININSGIFSPSRLKERLMLEKTSVDLAEDQKNAVTAMIRAGHGGLLEGMGIDMHRTSTSSLEGKKEDYYNKFDKIKENITTWKKELENPIHKWSNNKRVKLLIKKCKDCENEIHKLREIVRDFDPLEKEKKAKKEIKEKEKKRTSRNKKTI